MDTFTRAHIADVNLTAIRPYQDSTSFLSQLNSRKSRLLEFHLSRFDGNYEDCPDFFTMYNSVVGNIEDLNKVEKFQHLHACLDGATLNTIKSLEPADANYDKALELPTNLSLDWKML